MNEGNRPGSDLWVRIRGKSRTWMGTLIGVSALLLLLFPLLNLSLSPTRAVQAAGTLQVEIVAAYNLVVDSNVTSPSTYAPSVATVFGRFCNTGDADLTGVVAYIGNYTDTTTFAPGIYPARRSSDPGFIAQHPALANTGNYAFTHLGGQLGTSDARRFVGTLAPGECKVQYWHFTYPQCENQGPPWIPDPPPCAGDPVWGDSIKPDDDLWLQFDMWATSAQGSTDNKTWTMTMRNEISAMANKIKPNPDGQWFNTKSDTVEAGGLITTNGILYELGVINKGFDNDLDFVPDYNAWLQPVGDASYDPSCFRIVRVSSILTVTRSGGNPDMILHTSDLEPDPLYGGPLYFTNLPPDNTGTRGEVYYTFQAMSGPCATALSPYQEVASGYDNEKFSGDYGTAIPPVGSYAPKVTIDKSSNPNVIPLGGTTTYRIPFANTGTSDAGMGLSTGGTTPLVISDTVPDGMQYVGGSATYYLSYSPNTGVTRRYSTDSGATWSLTDPGTVLSTWPDNKVILQWWLNDALPAGSSGSYAQYQATVPISYSGPSFIENCADGRFGEGIPFDRACAMTMVQGNNKLGDWVWRDEDADAVQDAGEPGINAIAVSLYWDKNGDRALDGGDVLLSTMDTYTYLGTNGYYTFTNLPDGNYLSVVDSQDSDLPTGYGLTTPKIRAVALDPGGTNPLGVSYRDADFGFGPALTLVKTLTSENPSYEGSQVIYRITLINNLPGNGSGQPAACQYKVWAQGGTTGSPPKNFVNYTNAFGSTGPDGLYAYGDWSTGNNKWIDGRTYNLGNRGGNIITVEAIFQVYVNPALVDDYATFLVLSGTTQLNPTPIAISTAEFNNHVGSANAGLIAKDVTAYAPGGSWDWNDFSLDLGLRLDQQKNGGSDSGALYLDALGFRVTTDQTCGDPANTIDPLPLTDTFDNTKLQFVSATPTQSSVAGGTITWNNVGPLYPGQTKYVTVVFTALEPPGNSPTTHQNCGNVTDAYFVSGRAVNAASSCVNHTINPTARIGDYVWNDEDGDGVQDAGEQGIPNARVYLCAGNANPCNSSNAVKTTWTNANGIYYFDGVRDGQWTVAVDTSTLPPGWTQTYDADGIGGASANRSVLTIVNAADNLLQDFGYRFPAAIYGNVWNDADGDSNKEAGDNGISGVTVYLCTSTPCTSANQIQTTTTDANGNYRFGNLTGGVTYYVGIANTLAPLGADWINTRDPEGAPGDHQFAGVTVTAGRLHGSYDFGYYRTGTFQVGDTIYADWDGDGTQDAGEEGIANITVYLYQDDNGDGVIDPLTDGLVATAATDASGVYLFTNCGAGNYIVLVDRNDADFPTGYRQTQDPDEAGVCTTCDDDGSATLGPDDLTVDFGYQPYGSSSIGDFVWRDDDGDGVQDTGEPGIAGITVNLYEDSNNNGVVDTGDALVASTSTDANGLYLFSGLHSGNYLVDVDTTDPQLPTDGYGNRYVLSTANDPHDVKGTAGPLGTGESYLDADFGFTPGGIIGDYIWQDNDADGIQDLGEPGISGVSVRLYNDVNGNGVYDPGTDTLYATDTTDPSGIYEFTGLPAGNYVVVVDTTTLPPGFAQTGDPDLTSPCSGATCDSQSGLYLYPGQVDRSRDFGYKPEGVIGDTLWIDVDVNGAQDTGEPGVPYITVRLYSNGPDGLPNTADDVLVGTTVTDSDGKYIFGNLPDDGYNVRVDTTDPDFPPGLTLSYDPDEPNPCTVCDNIGLATLSPGNRTNLTRDFGYRYSGAFSLSGSVFYDEDNDGGYYTPANGDLPYQGITVYLYNSNRLLIGSTTTDANGYYLFNNLPNGNYYVSLNPSEPKLAGMTMTSSPNELPNKCTVCLNYGYPPLTTINNASVSNVDFGFYSTMDFGDLPDTYKTKLVSEGARHVIGNLYLGPAGIPPDGDGDSLPDVSATGDDYRGIDDENGVTPAPNANWFPGNVVTLTVTVVGNNGYLAGFFDWNEDGDFGEANEVWDFGPQAAGSHTLYVTVPSTATMTQYVNARFRLYDGKPFALSPQGLAYNGEVEDYRWPIFPTAVRLVSFAARGQAGSVLVTWETASEVNNLGFYLYRRPAGTQALTRLNEHLIPSRAPGQGEGTIYSFFDEQAVPGVMYEYILEDVDLNGAHTQHGPVVARALYAIFFPLVAR